MNKKEIYTLLEDRGIRHEVTEHAAVYNMAELAQIDIPYPDADAKNLFVRDDKKQNFYLITVKGHKRVDLKNFKRRYQTRTLSFASAEDLMEMLALYPGAVSPFGLLNDEARRVKLFLDRDFLETPGLIGVHPNDNTATVWLQTRDLMDLICGHGNPVETVEV